ncbi:AAA family ATPase [Phycicoccus sp. Soil802]|uniref:AAA family ATPase n=1 Tax=Phycicoccus sp. Soil802 TaxID=1736414 RepID=UPI000702642F|nr:AAA family ATPase [Phycicoccus sp. Soil802]KRF22919.1 hypothetical protein ASG91_16225 [Phycicoccus sp. Soil802]
MKREFRALSLDDALREVEARPFHLVPGLLDSRATMLIGQSEAGKSTLVADLIAAALRGEPFLRRDFTRPVSRVVVLSPEMGGTGEYAQRLVDRGLGRHLETERIVLYPGVASLSNDDWSALRDDVAPRPGDLVIVDPLIFILSEGTSLNSDEAVRSLWACLGGWVDAGAAVLIVHHSTRKRGQNGWQPTDGLGSSFFQAAARLTLTLRRSRGQVILTTSPNASAAERLTLSGGGAEPFALVAEEDAQKAAEASARRRDEGQAARFVEVARWAVENHAHVETAAELSRLLADQHPWLSGGAQPARQIAKHLSSGRKIGAFLTFDGSTRRWTETARPG